MSEVALRVDRIEIDAYVRSGWRWQTKPQTFDVPLSCVHDGTVRFTAAYTCRITTLRAFVDAGRFEWTCDADDVITAGSEVVIDILALRRLS